MESFLLFIAEHPSYAHWLLFSALILGGLNIPVSEDLIVIIGGVLASTVFPESVAKLFVIVFLGAYLADCMLYVLGRVLGAHLLRNAWFRRMVKPERLQKIEAYYAKYGVITLFLGRFIPFGVRNCLFMTAGMVRLSFLKFLIVDGLACLASTSLLFWLSYAFGRNYKKLAGYLEVIDLLIFASFLVALFALIWYKKSRKAAAK